MKRGRLHRNIKARQLGQTNRVGDPARPGFPPLHPGYVVVDQRVEDRIGAQYAGWSPIPSASIQF